MYFLIDLNGLKAIIPKDWVDNFSESLWLNYGVKKSKEYLVFFSNDAHAVPDFNVEVRPACEFGLCLDENVDGCFFAKVENFFRKLIAMVLSFLFAYSHNNYIL